MRTCRDCGVELTPDNMRPTDIKHRRAVCHPCMTIKDRARTDSRKKVVQAHGLTLEQYDEMLIDQGGGCAICGRPDSGRGNGHLHIDHNHSTGDVRGLLCHKCNLALGALDDDIDRLKSAITYLS